MIEIKKEQKKPKLKNKKTVSVNEGIKTQKSILRFKNKDLKESCLLMCKFSNNLANQTIYEIKKHYKDTEEMISYEDLEKQIKNDNHFVTVTKRNYNDNYKSLIASSAQQTMKSVYGEYKSFFNLLKLKQTGGYDKQVKEPGFKGKGGLFKVIYTKKQYGYDKKTHEIKLGISSIIKQNLGITRQSECGEFIRHKLPIHIILSDIKEVRIQPNQGGRFYHIEIVYGYKQPDLKGDMKGCLGIDIGINNLATCINSFTGKSFIIDGNKLKSYNQLYNKTVAKTQSLKTRFKQSSCFNNNQKQLSLNRYNYINNYFNQSISKIVKYCLANEITDVFVGKNKEWKTSVNMSKKNNQNFYSIPHAKFIGKLISKCNENGLRCYTQEESHTSKCSFMDRESIEHQANYVGKRVKRGLFRTEKGMKFNADVNGAANIMIKGLQTLKVTTEIINSVYNGVTSGLLNNPIRLMLGNNFCFKNNINSGVTLIFSGYLEKSTT